MRTLLLCSFMLLIPIILFPQDEEKNLKKFKAEFQNEFDEHQEKLQNEYDSFLDSINKEYTDLILEAENEFSELLKESFSEFKTMQTEKQVENKKLRYIPQYLQAPQEIISKALYEKEIPYSEIHNILISPQSIDERITSSTITASVQFLGNVFSVDFEDRIGQMDEILKIDAEAITNSYNFLRNTNYTIVLEQLTEICRQMNLNDWDFYCLTNEFSKTIIENKNNQKIVAWFLLSEANFKVKIGYFNDEIVLLFASSQTLYDIPWFNIGGDRYYAIHYEYESINTYNIDYFKGYKYLNIFHDKPILFEEIKKDKIIGFPYNGTIYSIPLSFDQNYVDYYSNYPIMPIEYYFAIPVSSTFKESVENNITPYLQNKSLYESLHFLLSLVQNGFNYKTDIEQFNSEKYMVPEEMIFYNFSDCDDRAIFLSFLVRDLLNLNVIALDINGHICSAVDVSNSGLKGNISYDNKEYLVCDATYTGAPPGILLPDYKIENAAIIDFNKHLNKYRSSKLIWESANHKGLLQADNTGNILFSNDGNVFLTGVTDKIDEAVGSKRAEQSGNSTTFIAKFDPMNEIQWIKTFQGSGANYGYCISESSNQFLYVFGYFEDSISLDEHEIATGDNGSFYLAKLDLSGKAYWLKCIQFPYDTLSQGITTVIDTAGNKKYYMPNDHFPHNNNYLMEIDDKGYCYIYAMLPGIGSGTEISKYFEDGGDFDIVSYLIKGIDNLLKQNYPKSVSLLYTLFQFLINNGTVIKGSSLLKTISTIFKGAESGIAESYNEVAKISEISNSDGITWIKTIDQQPVTVNKWQAQHKSRLKISFINGNARIDVLNGIKYGSNQIWNDVNYILLDKTTGGLELNYANQYRKKMPVPSQLL